MPAKTIDTVDVNGNVVFSITNNATTIVELTTKRDDIQAKIANLTSIVGKIQQQQTDAQNAIASLQAELLSAQTFLDAAIAAKPAI